MRFKHVDSSRVTVLSDKPQHEIDLPDGDVQMEYDIRSTGNVEMFLVAGEKLIPFDKGHKLRGIEKVRDVNGLVLRPEKKTQLIGVEIYLDTVTLGETGDDRPVEIAEPAPLTMSIHEMVGRVVGEAMSEATGVDKIDIGELVDDLPDDVDPEFGPGYMEMDEDYEALREKRRERGKRMLSDGKLPDDKKSGDDGDSQDAGGKSEASGGEDEDSGGSSDEEE